MAALVAGAGLVAGGWWPPPPPAADVVVSPADRDFGDVPLDAVVSAAFVVRNDHPVEVTCDEVLKGCSCTHAAVEPTVLPPGGEATLSVGWKLAGRRGRTAEAVGVRYRGPDGLAGVAVARIDASVRAAVEPHPGVVELSDANRSAEVVLRSPTGRAFRLTGAAANQRLDSKQYCSSTANCQKGAGYSFEQCTPQHFQTQPGFDFFLRLCDS